jgi:hypothetical protein
MTATNEVEKDRDRAEDQARLQLESIQAMVERLEHSTECSDPDPELCDLTDRQIYNGLNLYYEEGKTATEEEREEYHDEEEARQAINEDPLEVSIREGWKAPGGEPYSGVDYKILLCTGGPAVRIIGELDQWGQPESARLQYQDWFTPWELYRIGDDEEKTLVSYANCFYFGE